MANDRWDTKSPAHVPQAFCTSPLRTGTRRAQWPRQLLKPSLSCVTVAGVPRTVINEDTFLEGAAPPDMLIEKIGEALAGA